MSPSEIIESIVEAVRGSTCLLSIERVRGWMESDDIEVMAALWDLVLSEESVVQRIEPLIQQEEAEAFCFRYFERVIMENPEGEWADSRYSGLWEIASWYKGRSAEPTDPSLLTVKGFLAKLYVEGDPEIRNAIVTGALEHILEDKRWRDFFKDWRDDPVLRQAYEEALSWSK